MSFYIGKARLDHGLLLAPMAGAGDASMREICRSLGAEYTVTEMISARALVYDQRCRRGDNHAAKTARLAAIGEDAPCAVQLFGAEPDFMAEAAGLLAAGEYRGYGGWTLPAAIDINMGCPVNKVVSKGEGSALMRNPELAGRIVEAVRSASALPVTVKIRAGWDKKSINAPLIAKIAEQAGAAALCVHARTRDQMYSPGADWSVIGEVKAAVSIPVIGNGDVRSADDAARMLDLTRCDGVAVARGALGNPWIFSEIKAHLEGRKYVRPALPARLTLALRHARDIIARKGERVGFAEARTLLTWYIKGAPGAAGARDALMRAGNLAEAEKILMELIG